MARDYDRSNPREGYCVEAVWGDSGWRRHQCRFKIKVEREVPESYGSEVKVKRGFCNIHDPVRVAEKARASDEKYNREQQQLRKQRCLGWLGPRAIALLRKFNAAEPVNVDELREVLSIATQNGFE